MANPIGEENWLAYIEESSRGPHNLEQSIKILELHERSVSAEPGSLRLRVAYCNYFWSLWAASQSGNSGWSDEDQLLGRELFTFGAALDLWQRGYEAIKYRLDDSHVFWNRWISLEMDMLSKTRTPEGVQRISHLYRDRLVTPHITWDDTSQMYSSFLSEYNRPAWEDSMKNMTICSQEAKRLIAARDSFELRLKQAVRANDIELQQSTMLEYLEWEMLQSKRNNDNPEIGMVLCCGLYARALTGVFANNETVWHDYIVFLSSAHSRMQYPTDLLDVLRRAVQHCPCSGRLWNRYILYAEESKLDFAEIESIKHAATSENQLYKSGMESMIEMYVAWCGFLKRTAMDASATDEDVDVADVGLRAALEDVDVVGQRLYGKDFQGDPKFRLERIYIQYLTEKKGAIDEARAQWNKLASIQLHADSCDFWTRYYMWEMLIFSSSAINQRSPASSAVGMELRIPSLATEVLHRAVRRRTIDWPERALEVYLQHCNDYELSTSVRRATDMVHKTEKLIAKRREFEQKEKAATHAAYLSVHESSHTDSPGALKRKLDPLPLASGHDDANKRQKNRQETEEQPNAVAQQNVKRDRENTTVIVTNLPFDVTQTKIRQYFKDYGRINSITALVPDQGNKSSTSLIEFSSPEEAQSALLRHEKYFNEAQIGVRSGQYLTVYVTNYPPTADEKFIRGIFQDCGEILSIRWPSLKVNTHRRFCYVSFRNTTASAKAVQKDGKLLEGKYKLIAKYSDPGHRKSREGAVAEAREVYISGLSAVVTDDEIRNLFSKYGTVQRVNVPRTMAGKNRGFGYVEYESQEQAQRAVAELAYTKLGNQVLEVKISKVSNVKLRAQSIIHNRDSTSFTTANCGVDNHNHNVMGSSSQHGQPGPTAADIISRTIALMGLPDTLNDARLRALIEPFGAVIRLVLQPSHGGATVEFIDAATAGRASLQLDNMEFEDHRLRIGTVEELRHAQAEWRDDRIIYGVRKKATLDAAGGKVSKAIVPPPFVRRPVLGKLSQKRGLGFVPVKAHAAAGSQEDKSSQSAASPEKTRKAEVKTNADFKALFLAGSNSTDHMGKGS